MVRKRNTLAAIFFNSELAGGILLIIATIISLIISNSSLGPSFVSFWNYKIDLSFTGLDLNLSIQHWINDGLMTVYFLLVGLEIEKEIFSGELKNIKKAILPVGAAIGGMLVPALIYFYFNRGTLTESGFGIPMATDIAFAVGVLSLMIRRIPVSVKIFLMSLAIIDDIAAILIIAFFYSDDISWRYLSTGMVIVGLLVIMNRLRINHIYWYLVPGLAIWYCMLRSGIHPTITGVLLAFTIPFTKAEEFNISSKLLRDLHKPGAYFVLPVFALANAALVFTPYWFYNVVGSPNGLGILLGLYIGKPLGIILFSWILVKLKLAQLSQSMNWKMLAGAGMLAGIGFTMAMFITNLAFEDNGFKQFSKMAILVASTLSAASGLLMLYFATRRKTTTH